MQALAVQPAIEQFEFSEQLFTPEPEVIQPLVLIVPEMQEDDFARRRAERLIRYAGVTVVSAEAKLGTEVQIDQPDMRPISLMDAVKRAAWSAETAAFKLIETNVRTDVIERTIKAGFVMEVDLELDDYGRVLQHGQTMEAVHENTLRYANAMPGLRPRTEAETRNGFRIEGLHRQGLLDDYNFVVISRCADNMTNTELADAGFFADTRSCAIQVTTTKGEGLVTESAFVAGTAYPGGPTHDEQAVVGMAQALGVDLHGKSAAEIIDTPLLIHKSLMPNGAIDLVERYDEVAGGTFFGEAKPRQDYLAYKATCRQREAELAPTVQRIVAELISEAETLTSPLHATERLHVLSQRHLVDRSLKDTAINPLVFGREAAEHIAWQRYWHEQGNDERAEQSRQQAQQTAKSSSCPTGVVSSAGRAIDGDSPGTNGEKSEEGSHWKKMTCPFCGDKNQWGDVCSPNQHCRACNALVIGGKVVSKGNGGPKKKTDDIARSDHAKVVGLHASKDQEQVPKLPAETAPEQATEQRPALPQKSAA